MSAPLHEIIEGESTTPGLAADRFIEHSELGRLIPLRAPPLLSRTTGGERLQIIIRTSSSSTRSWFEMTGYPAISGFQAGADDGRCVLCQE